MLVMAGWFVVVALGCMPSLSAAPFAETKVFEIRTVEGAGALAGPILRDLEAGCIDSVGVLRRFGERCVAFEADALLTCALLSNCVAVQCLPAANFVDVPDRIGLDASGEAIGASEATLGLWRASAAGDPAGVARELARGADVNSGDAVRGRTPLMLAARSGSLASVDALVGAGASTLAVDSQGPVWKSKYSRYVQLHRI